MPCVSLLCLYTRVYELRVCCTFELCILTCNRTVLMGSVCKVEEQVCCEVEFEDGSVCDSIPTSDLIMVCKSGVFIVCAPYRLCSFIASVLPGRLFCLCM